MRSGLQPSTETACIDVKTISTLQSGQSKGMVVELMVSQVRLNTFLLSDWGAPCCLDVAPEAPVDYMADLMSTPAEE